MLRHQEDNFLFQAFRETWFNSKDLPSDDVVKFIDKYPAAAGRKDHDDNYPLHLACCYGRSEDVIMKLIDTYPHALKEKNKDGEYPLHIACHNVDWYGQKEAVMMKLIDMYPDAVKEKQKYGSYPLHIACQFCKSESVILRLIELFPQAVSESVGECHFPLHITCKFNSQWVSLVCQLMKIFPEAIALPSTYYDGMYPLHLACQSRKKLYVESQRKKSEEVIRKLVQSFPEALRIKDSLSAYPIHHAVLNHPSVEVIMFLVETDPFILQLKNKDGLTPFHCACSCKYSRLKVDIVEYFLQYSSTSSSSSIFINVPNNNGETPLHTSCFSGRKEIVQAIAKHVDVLDVNATNDKGDTALHKAIRSADYTLGEERYDMVQSLLQHPWIDINIRNELNETPLDLVNKQIIECEKLDFRRNIERTIALSTYTKIRTLLGDFDVKHKWQAYEYFLENFDKPMNICWKTLTVSGLGRGRKRKERDQGTVVSNALESGLHPQKRYKVGFDNNDQNFDSSGLGHGRKRKERDQGTVAPNAWESDTHPQKRYKVGFDSNDQ